MPTNLRSPGSRSVSFGWQATRRLRAVARDVSAAAAIAAKVEASEGGPPQEVRPHPPMSEISVTLPDGSSRRMPAGSTPGDVALQISPGLAKAALAALVNDRIVDLNYPLREDASVRIVTPQSPEALGLYRHSTAHLLAAAVTNLFPGAQCGIGPATDEGFFYDFVVDRPFVPEDLDAIEKKMQDLAAQDLPYERQMWPRDEAKRFFGSKGEPLKVQLIDEKTEGQSEVSVYTIKDRDTFVDFCVGPARAVDRPAQGVQAAEHVERVLEGRCAQPADAAHLWHGLPDRCRPEGTPAPDRGSKDPRPPQGREGSRTLHLPSVGAGRDVLAEQGHDLLQPARQLHARRALPRRLRRAEDAARLQQGAVGNLRPLAALSRQHVPHPWPRRRRDGDEGHELPRAHAGVRQRDAQLPGSAAALPRADAAPPQRSVRRAFRSHTRPAVLAGRCALLRDGRTDPVGGRVAAATGAARLLRLRTRVLGQALDPARTSTWERSRPGTMPKGR